MTPPDELAEALEDWDREGQPCPTQKSMRVVYEAARKWHEHEKGVNQ